MTRISCYLMCEHDETGRYHPTGHIRLLRPLLHPSLAGRLHLTHGTEQPSEFTDVIILERLWRPPLSIAVAEQLVRNARPHCRRLVYCLDDNLLDHSADARPGVVYLARHADLVLVSTSELAARVRHINAKVAILANALDERLFPGRPKPRPAGGKIVFGYLGTATHTDDLMLVMEPLRRLMHRHPGAIEFHLVGISADYLLEDAFRGLPVVRHHPHGSLPYEEFLHWSADHCLWDFAIAPLASTPLNSCKSDIKYLDYSLLGIPGIYSDSHAYRDSVRHEETGLVVRENPGEWFAAMERMYSDAGLRQRLAQAAYAEVCSNRTLQYRAADWLRVLSDVLA